MFSVANLLDRAKARGNIPSDYQLCKVIGIKTPTMSGYRAGKSTPDARVLEQLCALSGDDLAVVAAQIQAERERTPEAKRVWMMIAQRLGGTAAAVAMGVGLSAAPTPSHAAARAQATESPLYIMLRKKRYGIWSGLGNLHAA